MGHPVCILTSAVHKVEIQMPGKLLLRATAGEHFVESEDQTWNLSKNLHRRISRIKILHRQFHLISTVLVGKNTKNE